LTEAFLFSGIIAPSIYRSRRWLLSGRRWRYRAY